MYGDEDGKYDEADIIDELMNTEDSINGLRSGRAAGMKVVGLTTTNPQERVAEWSDIQIADYRDTTFETINALL